MKFSCEKYLLQNACNVAARAAASKSPIPALEGLQICADDRLTIKGYDLKKAIVTAVEADISQRGTIVLNARLFGEMMRRMPDGIVTISADEKDNVSVKCGKSAFNIMGLSSEDYPELPRFDAVNSISLPQNVLKDMINKTIFAVSTDEVRPIYTGTLFEVSEKELNLVSVDGYRLAQRREALDEKNELTTSFVAPGAALAEAERVASDGEDAAVISLGSRHIMFSIGDTEIISRRLEGEFLDYRKSVPKESAYCLKADRKDLLSVFERVSLIISEKYKSPVRCRFEDGLLKLSAATALGKATDECAVQGDAGGLEIGFNNRYILDALRAAPTDELLLRLSSPTSPCVIQPASEDGSFLYLILPVRIRSAETI